MVSAAWLLAVAEKAADPLVWKIIGFTGQGIFGARFFVQWLASEKAKKVVVPEFFWYLSIVGGLFSLAYAIYILSGPFILGQSMGTFVYARNLYLHKRSGVSGDAA